MKTDIAKNELTLTGLSDKEVTEMANLFGERCQQTAKKTVEDAASSGAALAEMRTRVGDQNFSGWMRKHWNYSIRTGYTYISVSEAVKRFTGPASPQSIRQAIAMIAEEKEVDHEPETVPRSERKTGQVEVVESTIEPDDDPAPDLPTQRATASGSRKVKEAEKPKTRPVVSEIVQEPEQSPEMRIKFAVRELSQVLSQIDVSERKKTAKQLRKLADELDPPDESEKIPTAAKLQTVCDMECDWSEDAELREALRTWIAQKQKYKKTEWRYQTVEAFKKDLRHLRKTISEVGIATVLAMLDKAERGGWRGWDHSNDNGKGNNGHGTGKPAADNGRPAVKKLPVVYK